MDGFELIVQLQANPQTRSVLIIVFSASGFESNHQRSLEAGATAFLPKPLQIDELLNKLRSLLRMDVCPIFISAVRQIGGFHATFHPSASGEGVQVGHYPSKILAQLSKTDPSKVLLTTKGIPKINSSAKCSKVSVAIATPEVTITSFLSAGGHTVIYIAHPIISNGFAKTYPLDSHAGVQRSPL